MTIRELIRMNELMNRQTIVEGVCYSIEYGEVVAVAEEGFDREEIRLLEGTEAIGNKAFFKCESLVNIEVPESVSRIETRAFSGCSSLTHIGLPKSLKSIEDYAFLNCAQLLDMPLD